MKKKPARGFRIVDAVVVAAGALLALKAISYLATPSAPDLGPDGLPRFARVIAHARSNPTVPDPETTGSVPDKAAPAPAAAAAPPKETKSDPAEPKGSPSERAIRERLTERREELQRQARDLETREKLVEDAERRADAKAEEARLAEEQKIAGRNPAGREAAALKGLVVMYETMKPKDAARVFDRLSLDVLVPIVLAMNPRKMAEILAVMGSEPAEKLTVALANRARGVDAAPPQQASAGGLPANELPALDPGPPARASVP